MSNRIETLRPEVKAMAELGNGIGGIKICSQNRAETLELLQKALTRSKQISINCQDAAKGISSENQ